MVICLLHTKLRFCTFCCSLVFFIIRGSYYFFIPKMIEVRPQFEINNLSFCSQRCNYCIFRSGHVHTNSWRCSNMCTGMENLNLSQKCPFSLQPLCVMTATHAMYSLNWSIQLKVVSNPSHITCSHQPPLSKSRFYLSTLSYIRLPI